MTEPVNTEIAKLLYKIGYKGESKQGYDGMGNLGDPYFGDHFTNGHDNGDLVFEAPTIAQVIMWLYREYGVWVTADIYTANGVPKFFGSYSAIKDYKNFKTIDLSKEIGNNFKSPEETYLEAITHVLTNLNK